MTEMQNKKLTKSLSEYFENSFSSILAPTIGRLWDIYALIVMRPLIKGFIPWTGVAIRPYTALTIINDIFINQRRFIVELGAGVSTILIAQALKERGEGMLVSFEDNEEWASFLNNELQSRGLNHFCQVVYAPLTSCKYSIKEGEVWYQETIIHENIANKKIDLILVDGPKASGSKNQLARFPAVPILKHYCSGSYSIYLDDIRRNGEKQILERWSKELNCKVIKSPIKGNFCSMTYDHSYYCRP